MEFHDGHLLADGEKTTEESKAVKETAIHKLRHVAIVIDASKPVTYTIFHWKSREKRISWILYKRLENEVINASKAGIDGWSRKQNT